VGGVGGEHGQHLDAENSFTPREEAARHGDEQAAAVGQPVRGAQGLERLAAGEGGQGSGHDLDALPRGEQRLDVFAVQEENRHGRIEV